MSIHSSLFWYQFNFETYLVSPRFSNNTEIGDIDSLLQGPLVGRIKYGIKGDVLEHFVDAQFVRIENHDD